MRWDPTLEGEKPDHHYHYKPIAYPGQTPLNGRVTPSEWGSYDRNRSPPTRLGDHGGSPRHAPFRRGGAPYPPAPWSPRRALFRRGGAPYLPAWATTEGRPYGLRQERFLQ
jgi:hypothetical protein